MPKSSTRGPAHADARTNLNPIQRGWLEIAGALGNLGAVPFIAGLLAAVGYLLLFTGQGPDLTHTIVQDGPGSPRFMAQVATLIATSSWLGAQAWFWSRRMVIDICGPERKDWKPQWLLEWLPRVLGAAPFVFAAVALLRNGEDETVLASVFAGLAVGFALLLWLRKAMVEWAKARAPAITAERLAGLAEGFGWLSIGLALVFLIWMSAAPVGLSQALGAVGVVYLGVGMIIPVMAALIHWGRYWRLPVVGAMVLLAVVLTALGPWLGDNHAVGRRAFGGGMDVGPAAAPRETFAKAFDDWYVRAPVGPDGRKTMIVVAAAGGASRAGYWAAEVLGRLQERSGGRFADSVFALSSVSGGSVGATAFVSQLYDNPSPQSGFQHAIRDVARSDYLSPALGGLLFPDLAQRFLPTIPLGGGRELALPDRAEALEKAFEQGWAGHCANGVCPTPDLWRKPFLALWRDQTRHVPLLFVNGARQEDGRRILTSAVQVTPDVFPDAVDFFDVTGDRDIAVSSAIHNGARFPLVSPGGTLLNYRMNPAGHVLDGGYFENSGVTTAGDIVRAAQAIVAADPSKHIRPVIIELNNDSDSDFRGPAFDRGSRTHAPAGLSQSLTKYFLADILGPLGGVSSSRDGRATPVAIGVSKMPGVQYELVHLCSLDAKDRHVVRRAPMDWALSKGAQVVMIRAAAGDACGNRAPLRRVLDALPPKVAAAPAEARP